MIGFGWFKGLPYGDCEEDFDKYRTFKNSISKRAVIEHIKSLNDALTSVHTEDIFTGEPLQAGEYFDGDFAFPLDFLHYYEHYDIGIPYDYEEYLKSIGVGNEG